MNIYKPICLPNPPDVLGGSTGFFTSSVGQIFYNTRGRGCPLLFVHGINAGASNFEWRCNFFTLSRYFQVFALDLPGFGQSEKQPIPYTADIYMAAVSEFITGVIQQPVYLVASGLSAAYAAGVAYRLPALVKALILVTPAGIGSNADAPCETSYTVFRLFTSPVQGAALYNSFVSRTSIRYFLTEFIYADPAEVTDELVDYLYVSSHQCPNAQYAPASFVAGLSNYNIAPFFAEITQPLLLLWGEKAKIGSLTNKAEFLQLNPEANCFLFRDSAVSPQSEQSQLFNKLVFDFFAQT